MSSDETLIYHQPKNSYSQRFSRSESDAESGGNAPATPSVSHHLFSRGFLGSIALGQVLSLLIATTTSTTASLAQDDVQLPVLQCLFTYFVIGLTFTTYRLVTGGVREYSTALLKYSGAYVFLAFVDLMGNYLVLKSFSYTSLLSVILLDTWAIPVVMTLSVLFMRTLFRWNHYLGAMLGIFGMVFLVIMDAHKALTQDVDSESVNSLSSDSMLKGDILCLLGATCYGISNVVQEAMSKKRHSTEVTAMIGVFGCIAATLQLLLFQRSELKSFGELENEHLGLFFLFVLALSLFYSLAPLLFKWTSAAFFNLSLLTSDFYGLIVGTVFLGISIDALYAVPFGLTMGGIILYNIVPSKTRDESLISWIKRKRVERKKEQLLVEQQKLNQSAQELLNDPENIQRQKQFL